MNDQASIDRSGRGQSPRQATRSSAGPQQRAAPSSDDPINAAKLACLERKPRATAPLPDRLWNFDQVCAFYGVSERKGAQMRAEGLLPAAVVLGPRALRWIPSECLAMTAGSLPRQDVLCEPAQLARARLARMKAGA